MQAGIFAELHPDRVTVNTNTPHAAKKFEQAALWRPAWNDERGAAPLSGGEGGKLQQMRDDRCPVRRRALRERQFAILPTGRQGMELDCRHEA